MRTLSFLRRNHVRERVDAFMRDHGTERRTLDVGCGNSPYKSFFPNRVSLDVAPGPGVDVVGSVYDLPFSEESFDCVVCTEVLEHLEYPISAVREMYRVLAVGGTLILTTRFLYPIHGFPQDYFRYTPNGLRSLLKDFEIETLMPDIEGMPALLVVLQSYVLEQEQTGLRWGRVGRVLLLFLAWCMYKIGPVYAHESFSPGGGNRIPSSTLASGYLVCCKKIHCTA